VASSGARLLREDAVDALVGRLFPLATVITPNLMEAEVLVGAGLRDELARRLHALGPKAVIVTGGHGDEAVDTLYDGERLTHIHVPRYESGATHGAGCTHSATLAAYLAKGYGLEEAATTASRVASEAVRRGHPEIGAGDGPVRVVTRVE